MTAKKSFLRPNVDLERQKREAAALRANLARRKQQQRSRDTLDDSEGGEGIGDDAEEGTGIAPEPDRAD